MVRLIPVSLFFRLVLAMMIDSTRIGLKLLVISFSRDSYNKKKGLDQEEAKTKYAEKLKELLQASNSPEAQQYLEELEKAAGTEGGNGESEPTGKDGN
ncbi:MAG: hypothetical protein CYPHOPRED_001658 [Cyphobasidiales sp. Tagirdzhanova-0007]|nr:MAG: hypothetical protein CYPHOPRED_001658 [Cyphobasidiales sp. Tagirdzhanova-0007]